jgi:hypothetical protein
MKEKAGLTRIYPEAPDLFNGDEMEALWYVAATYRLWYQLSISCYLQTLEQHHHQRPMSPVDPPTTREPTRARQESQYTVSEKVGVLSGWIPNHI